MPVKNLVHRHLRFMDTPSSSDDSSNTMVGAKSNGKIVTDSSVKIDGSGFKHRSVPNSTMSGVNSRNKETLSKLVKTIF